MSFWEWLFYAGVVATAFSAWRWAVAARRWSGEARRDVAAANRTYDEATVIRAGTVRMIEEHEARLQEWAR